MITGKANTLVMYLMQADREKVWDLTEHKENKKRSLDSNAYFHVLCDKLRQKLNISMARCKNHLIADYGQIEYIDQEPMIYKTNAPEDYMMELETIHTKCVKVSEENGHPIFFYRIYRGTHTYNTAEFAKLLEGTISECKLQGIETATPNEIANMQALWEKRYGKKTV
jgi:hypothetical protein